MKKLQTFAASGSCFAPEKIIIGKVIDKITLLERDITTLFDEMDRIQDEMSILGYNAVFEIIYKR